MPAIRGVGRTRGDVRIDRCLDQILEGDGRLAHVEAGTHPLFQCLVDGLTSGFSDGERIDAGEDRCVGGITLRIRAAQQPIKLDQECPQRRGIEYGIWPGQGGKSRQPQAVAGLFAITECGLDVIDGKLACPQCCHRLDACPRIDHILGGGDARRIMHFCQYPGHRRATGHRPGLDARVEHVEKVARDTQPARGFCHCDIAHQQATAVGVVLGDEESVYLAPGRVIEMHAGDQEIEARPGSGIEQAGCPDDGVFLLVA